MEAPEPHRAGPEPASSGQAASPDPPGPRAAEDARIARILAGARATRQRPSRGAWIAAAIVGAVCALGFVLLFAPQDEPRERAGALPPAAPARRAPRGAGCAGGFGVGLGLGIGIGFALARRRGAQAGDARAGDAQSGGDHSSRNRP